MVSQRFSLLTTCLAALILLTTLPAAAQTVFGLQTDFATSLSSPYGVTRLADGRVLVSELGDDRVSVVPAGGGARTDFVTGVSGPTGVTQLADGRVLVAEFGRGRVSVVPAGGGTRSDFATRLNGPQGITQLVDGRVLVAEFLGGRISAYTAGGGARTDFATGLTNPTGVTQLADGRVLVTEQGAGRVSAYSADGATRTDFAAGLTTPYGVTQLADGRVLVAEYTAGRVSAVPAGGGTRSDFATGLTNPTGVTQLADGRVLVTDFSTGRTLQFAPTGEAVAITEARFFNPSAARADGAGYRLLGAPVFGFDVTDLAARNLVQGIAAGPDPLAHPAQYANAGANLLTAYDGVAYRAPASTAEALTPGRGFFWYLYDIDVQSGNVPASFGTGTSGSRELTGFSLAAFGPQAEADVTLSFADNAGDDAQMLANPFARPMAVSGIATTGGALQGGVVQTYNPNGGSYVLRSGSDRLAPWQGAFGELVPTTVGDPVTVTYAFASTDSNPSPVFVGRSASGSTETPRVRFALAGTLAGGAAVEDEAAIVRFMDSATAGWDALDASKLVPPNAARALVAPMIRRDGAAYRLALDSRPANAGASVPLAVTATEAGAFTLSWTTELPDGWSATLTDIATGTTLDATRVSEVSFAATEAQEWTERFTLTVTPRGAVSSEDGASVEFALDVPRPNPARGASALSFSLAEAGPVRLSVIDLLGREVAVLVDSDRAAGRHTEALDASQFAPGVYVVRLVAGREALMRRIVMVR